MKKQKHNPNWTLSGKCVLNILFLQRMFCLCPHNTMPPLPNIPPLPPQRNSRWLLRKMKCMSGWMCTQTRVLASEMGTAEGVWYFYHQKELRNNETKLVVVIMLPAYHTMVWDWLPCFFSGWNCAHIFIWFLFILSLLGDHMRAVLSQCYNICDYFVRVIDHVSFECVCFETSPIRGTHPPFLTPTHK